MKKITQKLTKSFWHSSFLAVAFLFSLSINAQDLVLQGIIDFDVPSAGNDGKAIHVLVVNDIENLSLYGIGVANNGGGTDGQEYTFPAVSVLAGDHIMVARSPEAMASFLGATEANIMLASSDIGQNGDDAIELFYNEEVIETFGDINTDGTGETWDYVDSFAYKVDGAWTYGGVECTVGAETSATSSCPYPYTGVYAVGTQVGEIFDVTFSVNTENIQVGELGMYAGGGVLGGANAYAMSDDDGDSTWTVTIALNEGTTGNYIFLNSPTADNDWDTKEVLTGQPCADGQYNDRLLAPVTSDTTLQHCFGNCNTDGTCTSTTYDVTFSVNTANIQVGENGMFAGGGVLGGPNAYAMSDDDEDGTWIVTVALLEGVSGGYTFINSTADYSGKENITGQECADSANYDDRILAPITEDTTLLHCFGSCETDGTCPSSFFDVTFSVNTENITVGENGMYAGGGVLGDAVAVPLTDDGTGTWSAVVSLLEGTAGGYTFLNSPNDGGDWGAKEDLAGQECADAANYNDRILAEVIADITLLHCFGSCETDGTCGATSEPVLMPVDHENENIVYAWNDFGGASTTIIDNPDPTDVNTSARVAQSIKTNGSETWAGTFIVLGEQLDFSTLTTLAVDVWTPDGGELVNLKVENSEADYAIEINQPTTVASGWETLYYDLSGGDLSLVYNKLVLFFDFNESGDDTTYYFDNVRLVDSSTASTEDVMSLDMRIYPNPSNGSYVTIQTPVTGVKYVELFDITGKRLINAALSTDTLDVSSISTGMYLVKVTIEGQSKISKLMIR